MPALSPVNDREDLSDISDRMESIMSKYQHIQIPDATKEGSSSLDSLELLQISKQRLSKCGETNLVISKEDDPEEKQEDGNLSSSSDDVHLEKVSNVTEPKVSEITSTDQIHNSILDTKLTSSSSHSSGSNLSKNQTQKDELWALLNYSKVRLATGTTPTTSEAIALGMTTDDASQMTQEEKDSKLVIHTTYDENNDIDTYQNAGSPSVSSDTNRPEKDDECENDGDSNDDYNEDDDDDYNEDEEENDDDEDDGLPKFTKEQIEEARARAMAALSRSDTVKPTHTTPTMNPSDYTKRVNQNLPSGITDDQHHSNSFLMKSMALAEEAANAGEAEFKTFHKMSVLANMKTPTKGDRGYASNDKTHFSKVNEERLNRLGMNMRHFISNTRQKLKEAKLSITKTNRSKDDIVKSSVSPLKTFKENCLKVEKMNEEKYGEPWEKSS